MLTIILGIVAILIIVLAVYAPQRMLILPTLFYYQSMGIYRHWVPPPRKSVKDDVILITGGAMGMGAIMGEKFGKLGAKVVLWDIQEKQLNETVQKLKDAGTQAWGYTCDVCDRSMIYGLAERVKSEVGPVSILINNAGIMCGRRLLETSDETIEKTMQAFLPGMLERNRGHIVTISSSAGLFGVNRLAPYCCSKFAVTGLHQSLMCELFNMKKLASLTDTEGIHMTCVHPYFVTTPLAKGANTGSTLKTYTPEEAVDCIVNGVLRNKEILLMPPALGFLLIQKNILAGEAGLRLADALKVHNAFDNFEGRGWK